MQKVEVMICAQPGEQYSSGQTFFIKSTEEPQCCLEELAIKIFEMHTQHLTAGDDFNSET